MRFAVTLPALRSPFHSTPCMTDFKSPGGKAMPRLLTVIAVFCVCRAAFAFNPEEHKLAGDLGSQKAAAALEKARLLPESRALVRVRHGAADGKTAQGEDIRLVTAESVPKDGRFKGFVPREKEHKAS